MKNFTNGAIVFRIWRFDGSGEVISKHQYMVHAEMFARLMAENDARTQPNESKGWFFLAACESECEVKAFDPAKALTLAVADPEQPSGD